ncbi:unnamed protein product [Adineta steineri]|uniref:Uncharacterized protein n=1 Tax=Adineta steineri TaxID=433720 RepID=A0A814G7Y1_9BILA|nr:unnamed protein product [Adineta steineri]
MNIPDISYISPEQSNTNNPNKVQSDVNHLPPSYIHPTSTSPPFHTPQAQTSPFHAWQAQAQTLPPLYASQAQAVPSNTGAHLMQPGVYAPPTLFITSGPMPYQNMIVSGNYIHPETVYIRDYMIWSIINIFLGGLVLGIPAVWLSMVTRDRKQQGGACSHYQNRQLTRFSYQLKEEEKKVFYIKMNIPDISYISPEQSNTNNPNKVQSDVNHLPPSYIHPTSTSPPFHTPQAQTSPFYASQAQTQTSPPFHAWQAQAQTLPPLYASQAQAVPSNTAAHLMQPGVYAPPTLFITSGPMPYRNMIVSGNYIHPETVHIRDYLIWSIINIFLGGLVLGIPAVWLSMVTRDRKQQVNNRICISIGFGLFCELTYDEGRIFIDKKLPYLREQEVELSNKIAHIKANIKLVLEALKEIQTIDDKKTNTT